MGLHASVQVLSHGRIGKYQVNKIPQLEILLGQKISGRSQRVIDHAPLPLIHITRDPVQHPLEQLLKGHTATSLSISKSPYMLVTVQVHKHVSPEKS